MKRVFPLVLLLLSALGCDGGGSDLSSNGLTPSARPTVVPTLAPSIEPTTVPTAVPTAQPTSLPTGLDTDTIISGTVTFDKIPHIAGGGLNYDSPTVSPARGVTVLLLDEGNTLIRQTKTDDLGFYEVGSPVNTLVRIAVRAQMESVAEAQWQFNVLDNTEADIAYILAGDLLSSGDVASVRHLHAVSGWEAATGTIIDESVRPAAPFAILDALYEAVMLLVDVDNTVSLPRCDVFWSYRNKAAPGEIEDGFIGTSYYSVSEGKIYVLGDVNSDSDEYDFSVIQHEFGHFLEDTLSRVDSIGGAHGLASKIDLRVAFSEGFSNAFTAIVSGQPFYMDSAGPAGMFGFSFSLENNSYGNRGWYSENSIGNILYDISDSENETGDSISLGFTPIYNVLTSVAYTQSDAFSSIFLFNNIFKSQQGSLVNAALDELIDREIISGSDEYGSGEMNSGATDHVLPVYRILSEDIEETACSTNENGEVNGLGVNTFFRLTVTSTAIRNIVIERISGPEETDPDAKLYRNGAVIAYLNSADNNVETNGYTLTAGQYVLEVYDAFNTDDDELARNTSCFSVRVN